MKKPKQNYGVMSIRNRILLFSVLVTFLPSFSMGWMLNNIMHATITEKIEQQLIDSASIIEREIALCIRSEPTISIFSPTLLSFPKISVSIFTPETPQKKNPVRPRYPSESWKHTFLRYKNNLTTTLVSWFWIMKELSLRPLLRLI